jgi:hypothetical protein
MRPLFLIIAGAVALGAGAAAEAGSTHVQGPPQRVVLHSSDRFGVGGGSRIGCRVVRRSKRVSERLHCFYETAADSFVAKPGSYEVELAARGVVVVRVGKTRTPVFSRTETPPPGIPAGAKKAVATFGRVVHLQNRFDKVFLISTNIVCRPYGSHAPLGLLCVLIGSDGHVHDGTLLVLLTQRGVTVAESRHGAAVTVFRRTHGR